VVEASRVSLIRGEIELPLDGELSIGRDREADLELEAATVSRTHARVFEHGGAWYVEDHGSANGTSLNDRLIPPRTPIRLRHGDRLAIGPERLAFSRPEELDDPERTETDLAPLGGREDGRLSPFQLQVVRILCEDWLATGSLDRLPTNEEIAERLGTPGAAATVKAALRRAYAKAGVSELPPQAKRRALCRVARSRGWI
jgi:hypothetical protein